jgi:hypothetical protein
MIKGLKIWSLSNPGLNQLPFDHWPISLPTALAGPVVRERERERERERFMQMAKIKFQSETVTQKSREVLSWS